MVCQWLSTVKRICHTLSATYLGATDHCCLAYLVQSCLHLAWDFFVNGRNPDRLLTDDSVYAGNVIHLTYVREIRTLCRVINGCTSSMVVYLTPQGSVEIEMCFCWEWVYRFAFVLRTLLRQFSIVVVLIVDLL